MEPAFTSIYVVAEMNALAPMIELVRATDIATIVSTHALSRDDVKLIPLESPTPVRSPGLLWRRDEARTPAARPFASMSAAWATAKAATPAARPCAPRGHDDCSRAGRYRRLK
ncbi:LysR substrate-binding domain-containing protein [Paraburkholderia sp. LEh10]|uniref:LysR substrate-binding domain-containing protein n=1 Tax=Paraburkholderia sp. LEh10 TaxID=2821353 RepID=UPI001FD760C5|nr:LysR substrate-binding domain-containing protein [Paraburkholderia sp. LEh10]